jgi:molecular chaperone DnaJ
MYVIVHVKPHRFFRRKNDDVLLDLAVNIAQASLGADITVPTLDGEQTLNVPAGTQPGKVIKMRGKGIPHLNRNGRGDQLVIVSVDIPRSLDEEQQGLLEQLANTLGTEVKVQERSFLDSLKDLLGGLAD